MDKERFHSACLAVYTEERTGVGSLSEKLLHAALKLYFEPDSGRREVRVGKYIADAVTDRGIVEIQTRDLYKLKNKLLHFTREHDVTVVLPLPHIKWLCWIDPETGEVTKRRKSPKVWTVYDALGELSKLGELPKNPRIRFLVLLIDMEEYRSLDGWSRDKKRGSTRYERVPLGLADEYIFECPADYSVFLPAALPETFQRKAYAKAAHIHPKTATASLAMLHGLGVVERTGRDKNGYFYVRKNLSVTA